MKREIIKKSKSKIESEDIYSEESINEFVENDVISTRESAFMQGYFAAGGY